METNDTLSSCSDLDEQEIQQPQNGIVSDGGNDQCSKNQSNTSGDKSSRSWNECNDKSTSEDDTDIRHIYDKEPMVEVPNTVDYNVFALERQHSEQLESINNTYVLEKDDSNVTPDSSNICNNDNQVDQNDALANLIANLTLDTEENKKILKQLKKVNASLTQKLKECNSKFKESNRALRESTSTRDCCLIALQNNQTELEKYKSFNDQTVAYDKFQTKLNESLGQLARKDIDIKEGLKTNAYQISVVNQKHDELVKKCFNKVRI
nr:hypothetical protein [Tanacetum cinerariifolium]